MPSPKPRQPAAAAGIARANITEKPPLDTMALGACRRGKYTRRSIRRGSESVMRQTHRRACHLCEAICGLVIDTEDGRIVSIKGDPEDPLSRGHICPKAIALRDIHEDPDRLRRPLRKVRDGGRVRWEEIDWEDALDETAARLVAVRERHGVDAVAVYLGNPTVHSVGMMTHQNYLFRFFRTRNRYSATSVDQLPHHLVALWLFGHKGLFPIPDVDHTDYFLMLGANPVASNGSIWTVPDVRRRLRDLTTRGRLVVIDPRRTETARLASEHHFIRPGSDALFLAALLHTLFAEGLADPGRLAAFTDGLDTVATALAPFSPEATAAATGIDAVTTRRLARDFASARTAICYGRMGVSTQAFGALCQWLIQLLNIATGNLDARGGSLFTLPAVDTIAGSGPGGFDRQRSRVRGLPEFDRELPVAALAEEISTPGEGQVRALFTGAGNPVLSTPNGRALDAALGQLEFMVSLDPYLNETTRHADIILPPASPLEREHYDLAFHPNAVRNTARWSEALYAKPADSRHDWEIFTALGERVAAALGEAPRAPMTPAQIVDAGLRTGPWGAGTATNLSLARLREQPSGIDLGPLQPQLPGRLRTGDGRIHCAPAPTLADLARLRGALADGMDGLRLIGRRHVRDNNSWMHNYRRLTKGRNRCTLLVHPEDLARHGLADGARALLSSRTGSLTVTVEASDDVMPGVVSLPHGYGHDRDGIRLQTARASAGVSCNDITDERRLDGLSGNAAVNGVPVTLAAAPVS
jgi:anaerobic selenocysteine-containing dehydrogenase